MRLVILLSAVILSGCASLDGLKDKFENVPVCSVNGDKAYAVSMWGWLGIASEFAERYRTKMCGVEPTPAAK